VIGKAHRQAVAVSKIRVQHSPNYAMLEIEGLISPPLMVVTGNWSVQVHFRHSEYRPAGSRKEISRV